MLDHLKLYLPLALLLLQLLDQVLKLVMALQLGEIWNGLQLARLGQQAQRPL
jgi:hypothetical protein